MFQANLDYDPSVDVTEAERLAVGDTEKPHAHRDFARIWLSHDYRDAAKPRLETGELVEPARPKVGARVKDEYAMYGHFQLLRLLLHSSPHLTFYLDGDPAMDTACLSAFAREIRLGAVDALLVSINKNAKGSAKKSIVAGAGKELAKLREDLAGCGLSPRELELAFILNFMANPVVDNGKPWIAHPTPRREEPGKRLCFLTDTGDRDPMRVSRMVLHSSQSGVNRFFNSVRSSLYPMDRPTESASEGYGKWFKYSLYSPLRAEQYLTVFRTYFNYVIVGEKSPDGKTPAQRLGLAKRPLTCGDILRFDELDEDDELQ